MLFLCVSLLLCSHAASGSSIILDPGHSPLSPGAMSCSGVPEYQFNNRLVESLARQLTDSGVTVVLSKMLTGEASLPERAASATGHDLLLSLHHDSVQPRYVTRGRKGVCSAKAAGFSIFLSRQNLNYEQSLDYARRLGKALIQKGLVPSQHHGEPIQGENRHLIVRELGIYAFDELTVLKKAGVPALLLEAAVIVNPDDEKRSATAKFKEDIADAVLEMLK